MGNISIKSSVNTFSGGMNLDVDKSLLKENQYRYAENVRIIPGDSPSAGALTNIEGSTIIGMGGFSFGNYDIIATETIRDYGVIFTRNKIAPYNIKIYSVTFSGSNIPTIDNITNVSGVDLNIPSGVNIDIVGRYEDDDTIKIYWCDGTNFIRCINIKDQNTKNITDASLFDIVPSSTLSAPKIAGIGTGRLRSGIMQYCYQFVTSCGTSTVLSPMSAPVSISSSTPSDYSIKYIGTGIGDIYGKQCGKSVRVSIPKPSDQYFDKVRLISLYYYNSSESPVITIVNEYSVDYDNSSADMIIEDGGTSAIGELTVSELNAIGANILSPRTIESKDNILFAANSRNNIFDIDDSVYDTRAYQFSMGNILRYTDPHQYTLTCIDQPDYLMLQLDSGTQYRVDELVSVGDKIVSINGVEQTNMYITGIDGTTDTIITNKETANYVYGCQIVIRQEPVAIYDRKARLHTADLLDSNAYDLSYLNLSSPQTKIDLANHDTIHKEIYSTYDYSDLEYTYNKNGVPGGSGVNVDYVYSNTYFIESYGNFWNEFRDDLGNYISEKYLLIDRRTARIGDKKKSLINNVIIKNSDGSYGSKLIGDFGMQSHSGFLNYANPLLANTFKSYQRDEIYRFGAVFYDSKGRKSPVKWIADIRFPSGYFSTNDRSWSSSIFECVESDSDKAYSSSPLGKEELVVKPLGVTFTFRNLNLIPDVKKIEIVRTKRDINNKTVYAQGVLQKTGTYEQDYIGNNSSGTKITDQGPIGSLRPHPVISMAYNYAIAPMREASDPTARFDQYVTFDYIDDSIIGNNKFFQHEYAPSKYDRDFLLFINPETSFYEDDFVEQLKHSISNPKISLVDIIFPMSSRVLLNNSSVYYGNSYHHRMSFNGPNSLAYPTGIYMAADINPYSKVDDFTPSDTGTFCSLGVVGTHRYNYTGGHKKRTAKFGSETYPRYDIYKYNTDVITDIKPVYISLGGMISTINADTYIFKNGIDSKVWESPVDKPAAFSSKAFDKKLNSIVFKYYRRFRYSKPEGGSLVCAYQLSDKYNDIRLEYSGDLALRGSSSYLVDSFEYSKDLDNDNHINSVSSDKYVQIGGKTYINYTSNLVVGDGSEGVNDISACIAKAASSGQHGDGIVLSISKSEKIPSIFSMSYTEKEYAFNPYTSEIATKNKELDLLASCALSTFVSNLKMMSSSIYGGASKAERQFSEYISTGAYVNVASNSESIITFGGDTFIGIFDYTITRNGDPNLNKSTSGYVYPNGNEGKRGSILMHQKKYVGALIPLESSINLHLVNSKSYIAGDYNPMIWKNPGVYGPAVNEGGANSTTQDHRQYDYNSAYSSEPIAIGHFSKILNKDYNALFDYRIWSSEKKSNNETMDSWATFRPANYIDVDSRYGQITRLKSFDNKLFFWQENSFGIASVNDRVLIKSDNISELTLGTGGVLARFDYISTWNGMSKNTILGLGESKSGIYWFDSDRAEICFFNNSISSLGKMKGIQSVLNSSKDVISNHIPMAYDNKYNEMLITINGLNGAESME